MTPEDIEALRKLWGLDDPLYVQYFKYMRNLLMGDFGMSFYYREPVKDVVAPRLINTLMLMGPAMIMSIIIGSMTGSYIGWKTGSKRERVGITLALLARSFPDYLTGIIGLMLFAHFLDIFPLGGMRTIGLISTSFWENFLDVTHHLALPLTVALIYYIGDVLMIARTSILELVGEEFLEFAKARGLGDTKVRKIAIRNAIIPVVTYATVMIGFAFGGQVLLETVFSWPGIGRLMINSVTSCDYPVAQASFFIMAFWVIFLNLIVDLLYGYLDPRITSAKK